MSYLQLDKVVTDQMSVMSLNSAVYELTVDKATGKTNHLFKQRNNTILCFGIHTYRRLKTTYTAIKEEVSKLYAGYPEPLKEYHVYPLLVDQLVKNPDSVDENDVCNYTVVYGYCVEERHPDPSKPIVAPNDPEGRQKAVEAALKPYYVQVPFLMAVPEDPRYMFYVSLDFTPQGAVTEWDSSIKQEDPFLNKDDEKIQSDTSRAYISPEDLTLQAKIRAEMDKQITTSTTLTVDGKLPDDFNFDFDKIATAVGMQSGDEVKQFLAKFQTYMSELNPTAPELPKIAHKDV